MRKLGHRQEATLRSLWDRKYWYVGCGWYYGNTSTTIALLDSLVQRGFAHRVDSVGANGKVRPEYHPYQVENCERCERWGIK